MGIRAMSRDEHIMSYVLRLLMQVLMNITLGMIGTVIGFIWSLYSVIVTYQANIMSALVFFGFASLAAISFAFTWLIGIYLAAAGTVYVGAKAMAANLRLEGQDAGRTAMGRNIQQRRQY